MRIRMKARYDMGVDLVQPAIDVAAKYGLLRTRFPARERIERIALPS